MKYFKNYLIVALSLFFVFFAVSVLVSLNARGILKYVAPVRLYEILYFSAPFFLAFPAYFIFFRVSEDHDDHLYHVIRWPFSAFMFFWIIWNVVYMFAFDRRIATSFENYYHEVHAGYISNMKKKFSLEPFNKKLHKGVYSNDFVKQKDIGVLQDYASRFPLNIEYDFMILKIKKKFPDSEVKRVIEDAGFYKKKAITAVNRSDYAEAAVYYKNLMDVYQGRNGYRNEYETYLLKYKEMLKKKNDPLARLSEREKESAGITRGVSKVYESIEQKDFFKAYHLSKDLYLNFPDDEKIISLYYMTLSQLKTNEFFIHHYENLKALSDHLYIYTNFSFSSDGLEFMFKEAFVHEWKLYGSEILIKVPENYTNTRLNRRITYRYGMIRDDFIYLKNRNSEKSRKIKISGLSLIPRFAHYLMPGHGRFFRFAGPFILKDYSKLFKKTYEDYAWGIEPLIIFKYAWPVFIAGLFFMYLYLSRKFRGKLLTFMSFLNAIIMTFFWLTVLALISYYLLAFDKFSSGGTSYFQFIWVFVALFLILYLGKTVFYREPL